jgi:aspartate carbamoyltransferase catalytic subunit
MSITPYSSSIVKGESLIDTIKTLESLGADVIVMRHSSSGAPYLAARYTQKNIINAGDGWHAHPTQALLDLYTIRGVKGGIEGLKVVIVGDILHSRVARSNIWGLSIMGAEVVLCAPPTLLPPSFLKAFPWIKGEMVLDRAIEGADVVMPLRLQWERHTGNFLPSLREYIQLYQINPSRLALCKRDVVILHPGPVNEGIEISPELTYSSHSLIEAQVRNGVAVRMALLYLLCGGAK